MAILVSQKILDRIKSELSRSTESFLLISAYCKRPLVEFFDSCISSEKIEKKLVVRFQPEDIVSGASDLEIYPYCKEQGWKLYFRLDLHAKTYVFDRIRCIVGSANATANGLSIGGTGNYEMATYCELEEKDVKALDMLLYGAVEMTDSIYDAMSKYLECQHKENGLLWPEDILKLFKPDYSILFAEDFPTCDNPLHADIEDLLFLNLGRDKNLDQIKMAFAHSKSYLWLVSLIQHQDAKELYFGAITSCLHNVLLNEPKPYRKDVKQILANLLSWVSILDMEEIEVDRPHHSQRVRLKNSKVGCNYG